MIWCHKCKEDRPLTTIGSSSCIVACNVCGLVLLEDYDEDHFKFSTTPPLPKNTHPTPDTIHYLAWNLGIFQPLAIKKASILYQFCDRNGYATTISLVACCLYIGCRAQKIPISLIDFALHYSHNVYKLGLKYLFISQDLILDTSPHVPDLVDPTFCIHRYTYALLKQNNLTVSVTALRIIASMRSNCLQSGKKLGKLCAAAVYMAALVNGFSREKLDVNDLVPVCQAMLTKKLVKYGTEGYERLAIEFRSVADEFNVHHRLYPKNLEVNLEVICQHKGEKPRHGLCEPCFTEFVDISRQLSSACKNSGATNTENAALVPKAVKATVQVSGAKRRRSKCVDGDAYGADQITKKKRVASYHVGNASEQERAREESWVHESVNKHYLGGEGLATKEDRGGEDLTDKGDPGGEDLFNEEDDQGEEAYD